MEGFITAIWVLPERLIDTVRNSIMTAEDNVKRLGMNIV